MEEELKLLREIAEELKFSNEINNVYIAFATYSSFSSGKIMQEKFLVKPVLNPDEDGYIEKFVEVITGKPIIRVGDSKDDFEDFDLGSYVDEDSLSWDVITKKPAKELLNIEFIKSYYQTSPEVIMQKLEDLRSNVSYKSCREPDYEELRSLVF